MQIVRLDAAFDERAHERAERFGVVIDAAQQHRLADSIGMPASISRAQAARACCVSSRGWLACSTTIGRLAGAFSARTSAGVIRSGATTGMRVCTRITFT